MGYTYNSLFEALCNTLAIQSSVTPPNYGTLDPNWAIEVPQTITYAEQRIQRELDLIAMRVTDQSGALTSQQRTFDLPTTYGTYIVPEYVNVITPSTAAVATGTRNQLTPVSRAYLNDAFPSNTSGTGLPEVFSMQDDHTVVLGPVPNQNYPVEIIGTQRVAGLTSANQTNWLGDNLPDLLFAACMVKACQYMQAFTVDQNNPNIMASWEAQYQALMKSADSEEARKFYRSQGWQAQAPRQVTTPPRV